MELVDKKGRKHLEEEEELVECCRKAKTIVLGTDEEQDVEELTDSACSKIRKYVQQKRVRLQNDTCCVVDQIDSVDLLDLDVNHDDDASVSPFATMILIAAVALRREGGKGNLCYEPLE